MGTYGTITLAADGSYTYTLDNTNPLVQQLAPGETLTETYNYTLTDKDGDTSTSTLTITITGTDDLPVAVADTAGILEDAVSTTGNVLSNDTLGDGTAVDNTAALNDPAMGSWHDRAGRDGLHVHAGQRGAQRRASLTETYDPLTDKESDGEITITTDDLPVAAADRGPRGAGKPTTWGRRTTAAMAPSPWPPMAVTPTPSTTPIPWSSSLPRPRR